MATGWTAGLIAPRSDIHTAAHAAIDSTGGSITNSLRDQVLGSRVAGAPPVTSGQTGSASTFQNAGIPSTIQAAVANLNTNVQNQSLAQLLNQVLHGTGSNAPSPAQEALFRAQAEQVNQNMQTAAGPTNVQAQINALQQKQAAVAAADPLANRSAPIAVRPTAQNSYDTNLQQSLYGDLANAKQAQANGWISQPYADPSFTTNAVRQQQSGIWNAGRITY